MPPPGQAAAVDASLPLVRFTPKSSRSGHIAAFTTAVSSGPQHKVAARQPAAREQEPRGR